ncbi:hypothetical protein [Burkholderia gladioli]|uniref:hypothetical protein n=1 Tax=Burkholderia gladioli TaxID=28095 RepID=UPI00163E43E5|nr:hypothetical protein [Burkholderia gladioli]
MTNNTTAPVLTDEQIVEIYDDFYTQEDERESSHILPFARAIERALLTSPRAAGLPNLIEKIAEQWDGCFFDAPGGCDIDIGEAIRAAAKRLDAAPAAPVAEPKPYFSGVSELIIRDVCEMEPANPDLSDTICIDVSDLQAIVKRHTEMCATCNGHGMIGGPSFSAPDEGGVPCPDCAAPAAEAKSAENAELASMTRMFHAACSDLGLINEALGLDPDDGGAEPILDAIQKLKEERDQWADAGYAAQAVAADGAPSDDLLQLDVLLADLHAAVWHAAAGDDGPVDYDVAGKDEAKAIQRHVRAMLAERAAVSPATAEKVYYGGSVEAGPVAFDEPDTADELAALPTDAIAYRVLRRNTVSGEWITDGRYWQDGPPSAELIAETDARSDEWRIELAFGRASQAAAPAEAREPVGRFDKSLNQILWRDGLVNADFADRQPFYTYPVGATAEAREPHYIAKLDFGEGLVVVQECTLDDAPSIAIYGSLRQGTPGDSAKAEPSPTDPEIARRSVFLTFLDSAHRDRVADALVGVPADAGEAVAPSADLIARCIELCELSDHGESDQTALRALADTYRRDIHSVDRKAMAVSHTHREAVQYVLDAARAQGAQGGKGGEA